MLNTVLAVIFFGVLLLPLWILVVGFAALGRLWC